MRDFHHLVRCIGAEDVEEHTRDAVQQLAAPLEGDDGILERRRLLVVGNRIDFFLQLLNAFFESRFVVLRLDAVERSRLERRLVFPEKRIIGSFCHAYHT